MLYGIIPGITGSSRSLNVLSRVHSPFWLRINSARDLTIEYESPCSKRETPFTSPEAAVNLPKLSAL
jgi:hypothetical protein